MDPISFAVTVLAIYGILSRSPNLAGEAVREWGYARRGEESPAAKARRKRLEESGIDPATGGAFRQYTGNVWRDFWLDKDAERQAARARRGEEADAKAEMSWWERQQQRMDDEISRRADRWRTRTAEDPSPHEATDNGPSSPDPEEPAPGPGPSTPTDPDPVGAPDPGGPTSSTVHDDDYYRSPGPSPEPEPDPDRPPIRVTATVGDPIRPTAPTEPAAAITAGGTMTIVAQQAVTGVVSGANEARAIQRQVEAATAEYVAQLAKVRARIHALGEQTLGIVQMSARSQVVALTASAAESAAAAQAAAKGCASEVSPLMGSVARAFDRINS